MTFLKSDSESFDKLRACPEFIEGTNGIGAELIQ